jgi:hypothetical protein
VISAADADILDKHHGKFFGVDPGLSTDRVPMFEVTYTPATPHWRVVEYSDFSTVRERLPRPNTEGKERLRQRRLISQPRVARNELPWVLDRNAANSEGVEDSRATEKIDQSAPLSSTHFGVGGYWETCSQGSLASSATLG